MKDLTSIRGFLEAQRMLLNKMGRRPPGAYYTCFADFLLTHGREWTFRPFRKLKRNRRHLDHRYQGELGMCYRDAFMVARNDPELAYCEGLAATLFPVEHAWCVTRDGRVIDPSWYHNRDQKREYFGVAIELEFVREMVEATELWCGALCVPQLKFPILKRPVVDWKHPYNEKAVELHPKKSRAGA